MANTATTSNVIDHTSDAGFRAWVSEIITTLTSTLTLVQTADTGQINTSTVTRPSTNASAGYAIFRFSDTLQATSPVFIRMDFGTGSSATGPQFWITVGTATNGAGTLTGHVTLTQACTYPTTPSSTITAYSSRWVVNMTLGYVGLAWKQGGNGGTTTFWGGFQIFRSNDNTGSPTGDAIIMLTNGQPATATFPTSMPVGVTNSMGYVQCLSYLTNLVYPPTPSNGNLWFSSGGNSSAPLPFNIVSTAYNSNAQVFQLVYMTPVLAMSAFNCYGILNEETLGSSFSTALVGTTALTFLSIGQPWGSTYLGAVSTSAAGFCMLWQ